MTAALLAVRDLRLAAGTLPAQRPSCMSGKVQPGLPQTRFLLGEGMVDRPSRVPAKNSATS